MVPADGELRISWSRLKAWEECTEKGYLIGRGLKSPAADLRIFFKGTVVDRCMRRWLDQPEPIPGWMAAQVDTIFDEEWETARTTGDGMVSWRDPGEGKRTRDWCRELVTRLEPILNVVAIPFNYQPAVRFSAPLIIPYLDGTPMQITLHGEMDLLCENPAQDPRQFHIWDLKGTVDEHYWKKCVGQLVFYDIACFAMFGVWPVRSGLIQPMCQAQTPTFTFTDQHRNEMLGRIERVAHKMWRNEHRPKASNSGCDICPVQHACPKWGAGRGRAPIYQ